MQSGLQAAPVDDLGDDTQRLRVAGGEARDPLGGVLRQGLAARGQEELAALLGRELAQRPMARAADRRPGRSAGDHGDRAVQAADDVDEPADRPGADHIGLVHDEEQPRAAPGEPSAEGVGVVGEPLDEGRDQDGDGLVERRVANGGVQAVPDRHVRRVGQDELGPHPGDALGERDGDRVEACGS